MFLTIDGLISLNKNMLTFYSLRIHGALEFPFSSRKCISPVGEKFSAYTQSSNEINGKFYCKKMY